MKGIESLVSGTPSADRMLRVELTVMPPAGGAVAQELENAATVASARAPGTDRLSRHHGESVAEKQEFMGGRGVGGVDRESMGRVAALRDRVPYAMA
ncbi:hypothetical protein Hsar01_02028 [Haloferula sargassicola]|uniref:Uncharacterized protein n=1 Tax=Haloferula sargassicola TaxID=490096 RepID=A0ABP9US28_9BACT